MKAFLVMGRTVKAAYDDLFACVFLSISWWIGALLLPSLFFMLASTINLPFSIAVSIALLLPLAAAPVTVGVHRVTNRIANYARIDNSLFWEAIPQHIGRGLILLAICLSVPAVILFYILVFFNNRSLIIIVFCAWMLLLALMIGQFIFVSDVALPNSFTRALYGVGPAVDPTGPRLDRLGGQLCAGGFATGYGASAAAA